MLQIGSLHILDHSLETPHQNLNSETSTSILTMTLQQLHESLRHSAPSSGKYNIKLSEQRFSTCDHCYAAKLLTPPQGQEASRITTSPGEIVKADLIGPINNIAPDAKYVSVLMDRAANYLFISLFILFT